MKYIFKSLIAFALIILVSCSELTELGVNPNAASSANDAEVLTSAQGYLAVIQDVDLNQGSFLWAQYYTWGIGVSIGNQERYVAEPDDTDGYWARIYTNCLADLKFLSKSTDPAYRGISKLLTAYAFQGLVDHYGDIPYSQAVSGELADGGILTPEFDDAADIYAGLISSIDEGLDELSAASSGTVSDNDLIYGGDLDQWIKFGNSLKLRLLMRTSEVSPNSADVIALINSGTFLETVDDIAQLSWSGTTGNANPMWSVMENGVGDFYFASNATLNVLDDLGDPRGSTFYRLTSGSVRSGTLYGIDQGTIDDEPFTADADDYSTSSDYANSETAPTVLMSPWEVWFLRAEAAARYGTADDEEEAFETAIQTNFDYMGVAGGAAYIASLGYSDGNSLDTRIDDIAVQKWISMNGTQEDEGWIETRRFDRPASRLFTNGIFQNPPLSVLPAGTFPASWLYPASERSYNPKAPAQREITDRLFWDN